MPHDTNPPRHTESGRASLGVSTSIEFLARGETVLRMESAPEAESPNHTPLIHPGEVLQRDFLEPHQLSGNKLATKLGLPPNAILAILHGTRGISGPMSVLLGRAFNVPDEFFATLYSRYQVDMAVREAQVDLTAAQRVVRAEALARELHPG